MSYQPLASGVTASCWKPGAQRASVQVFMNATGALNAPDGGVGSPFPGAYDHLTR